MLFSIVLIKVAFIVLIYTTTTVHKTYLDTRYMGTPGTPGTPAYTTGRSRSLPRKLDWELMELERDRLDMDGRGRDGLDIDGRGRDEMNTDGRRREGSKREGYWQGAYSDTPKR